MVLCTRCGTQNGDENLFCIRCGVPLKGQGPRQPSIYDIAQIESIKLKISEANTRMWMALIVMFVGFFFGVFALIIVPCGLIMFIKKYREKERYREQLDQIAYGSQIG